MFVNSDFSDLLRIFNDHNVRYMVIGGYAVVQYAKPRFTKDLDLLISTDTANAKAVYDALLEFGAPLAGLTEKDFSEEGFFFQMGVPPVRVEILMGISGIQFEACWSRRVEVDFDGLKGCLHLETGFDRFQTRGGTAKSITGKIDNAFEHLEKAAKLDGFNAAWAWEDPDLQWIRDAPRFTEIVGPKSA